MAVAGEFDDIFAQPPSPETLANRSVSADLLALAQAALLPLEVRREHVIWPVALFLSLSAAMALHVGLVGTALLLVSRLPDAEQSSKAVVVPSGDRLGRSGGQGNSIADLDEVLALAAAQEASQVQPQFDPGRPRPPTSEKQIARELDQTYPALPPSPTFDGPGLFQPPPTVAQVDTPTDVEPAEPAEQTTVAAADTEADLSEDEGSADRASQLFAEESSAVWVNGRAVAQEGRDHKIAARRAGLATFAGQMQLPRPTVIGFLVTVDRDGTPTSVTVKRSSGVAAVDDHFRLRLLESWFDPDPTGDGEALGKPFPFTWVLR